MEIYSTCAYKDPDTVVTILRLQKADLGQVEVFFVIVDKRYVDFDGLGVDVAVIRDVHDSVRHAALADKVQHVRVDREIQRGLGGEVIMVTTPLSEVGPLKVGESVLRRPLGDVGALMRNWRRLRREAVSPTNL